MTWSPYRSVSSANQPKAGFVDVVLGIINLVNGRIQIIDRLNEEPIDITVFDILIRGYGSYHEGPSLFEEQWEVFEICKRYLHMSTEIDRVFDLKLLINPYLEIEC